MSLETKTQSQLIGRFLHELAAPPGSRWYGPEGIKGRAVPRSTTPDWAELVRPGGYQGEDRVPLSGSTCPAGRDGMARKVPREQPRGGAIAQQHPSLGRGATTWRGPRPRGPPSPSCTTLAWATRYGPEGTKAGRRHRPAAPPPPGLMRYGPKGAKGMTTGVAIAQQHYPHVGCCGTAQGVPGGRRELPSRESPFPAPKRQLRSPDSQDTAERVPWDGSRGTASSRGGLQTRHFRHVASLPVAASPRLRPRPVASLDLRVFSGSAHPALPAAFGSVSRSQRDEGGLLCGVGGQRGPG